MPGLVNISTLHYLNRGYEKKSFQVDVVKSCEPVSMIHSVLITFVGVYLSNSVPNDAVRVALALFQALFSGVSSYYMSENFESLPHRVNIVYMGVVLKSVTLSKINGIMYCLFRTRWRRKHITS